MSSASKIQKLQLIDKYSQLPDQIISELSTAFDQLCSTELANNVTLTPYIFRNSNAADRQGVAFSKAYCDLVDFDKGFILGDIFRRGLEIGVGFLAGEIPENKHEKVVLDRLMQYLENDADNMFDLDCMSETELTKVLANHLFGKLSTSSLFTINKECKEEGKRLKMSRKCSCCRDTCKLTGQYGDTSIGNHQVWHGSVDIIIENSLIVDVLEGESDNPGETLSPLELKAKSAYLSKNPQLVAETIVFSFLQKRRHPEREHFLTPCIGVKSEFMFLMLYDSYHDVLLESSPVSLTSSTGKFKMETIIMTWLAVNYEVLCTGLTEEMVSYKANFYRHANSKIGVYENELMTGNVESCGTENFVLPTEWSYNSFLLEQHNKIEELRRKRALRYCKDSFKR